MKSQQASLSSLVSLYFLIATAFAACYFPNGQISPNDTPCQDDKENSVCCGQGYACLSNGICQATGKELQKPGATEFVRGGCTDKSFRSSSCPLFCIDPDFDNVGGGMGIAKCANTDEDLYYCINGQVRDVDCKNKRSVLYFPGQPSAITTIGISPTRSSSVASSETSTSGGEMTSQSSTKAEPTTNKSPNKETATSEKTLDTQNKSSNNGPIIGGAVAGGVLAIAIAAVSIWWFLRRRSRRRSEGQQADDRGNYTPGSKYSPYETAQSLHEAPGSYGGSGLQPHHSEMSAEPIVQEMPTSYNERFR